MLETPKVQKMKLTGYICLGFAMVLTILGFIKAIDFQEAMQAATYWGTAGIAILTANSAKRIVGNAVSGSNE